MGAVFFWDGDGAGVEVEVIGSKVVPGWDMGVAVEEDISWLHWDWGHDVVVMTVGGVDQAASAWNDGVICHDREVEYHLVYFGVTVSSYTK